MAANESEYIRKTQDQLGSLIKKPPLTEKLLSKPPFRFLHDVIMAVVKQTQFMDGLYEGDEIDAQKVNNDKEAKIAFLQKAIDAVQMTTGQALEVKPAKIVAGQEADKTNDFLQAMASAAKKGANVEIVKRVLKGEKPDFNPTGDSGGSAGSNKENRDRSDSSRRKEEKEKSKESKERTSSKDRTKDKEKEKEKEKEKTKEKPKEKDESKSKSGKEKEKDKEKEKSSRSTSKTRGDDEKKKKKDDDDTKKSSKSLSATTKRSSIDRDDEADRKRRSSKSAKSIDDKKIDSKSDDKSKRRQSSAAAKVDLESKDESNGEKESKKRSSSSKREKEKEKEKDLGGLRIDLSSGNPNRHDQGDIIEIDHRIEDESLNGAIDDERPRLSAAVDDQEATSSLKTGGAIVRSGAARPSSAAGVRPGTASGGRPGTAARPAPPRFKRQELGASNTDIQTSAPLLDDNKNGQQINQSIRPPVLIQNEAKKSAVDDDDDDFIVETRDASGGIDALILNDDDGIDGRNELDVESGEHGQLVRKILETKKELESQLKNQNTSEKPLVVFDAQEREKTKKETGKLQEVVQQLTRTSHPLAKIVDFLQEDVDSMLKELQQWKQESKKDADQLRQETTTQIRKDGGLDLETMKNKLSELDQQIIDQSEAITAIRGVILSNEQRIQKMMSAIAKK